MARALLTSAITAVQLRQLSGKAGGIVGYLYVSSSYYKKYGGLLLFHRQVSGTAAPPWSAASTTQAHSTLDKLFFLEGESRTDSNAESKTSDELKALAFPLGGAFIKDSAGINDGYPIFRWQIPTYAVTFTVDPAGMPRSPFMGSPVRIAAATGRSLSPTANMTTLSPLSATRQSPAKSPSRAVRSMRTLPSLCRRKAHGHL